MSGARILVVDDDQVLLDALGELIRLRIERLDVDTCDMPETALERVAAIDYDAVVADIKMPGMDGLELLGEIRARRRDTPTLLITGHGDQELAVQALRAGAFDYITKPIDRAYFIASLKRAISSGRIGREMANKRAELERHAQELEQCIRAGANELRELVHREWTTHAELHLVRCQLEHSKRRDEPFASLVARGLASWAFTAWVYAMHLGRSDPTASAWARGRSVLASDARRIGRLIGKRS